MIQAKDFTDIYRFLERNAELTRDVKITRVQQYGFNDMEGWQYQINFKLVTVDGYRDKLVQVNTNSTYIEDWEDDDAPWQENLLDYLRSAFMVSGGFVKYLNAQGVEQTIALDKDSQSWQYAFIARELSFYCPKIGREQVPGIDF